MTYKLWYLHGKSWREIGQSEDLNALTRHIKTDIEFTHGNVEYIISIERYDVVGLSRPMEVYKVFCVTQMRDIHSSGGFIK